MLNTFGKLPSGERLKSIEQATNYRNGKFHNIEPTEVTVNTSLIKMLKEFFNKPKTAIPSQPLPGVKTDLKNLVSNKPTIIWFGHSSYLISCSGLTVLVDPVFSGNAAPFRSMVKAFKGADIFTADDLPEIDVLLITHDHYDHLDHSTIRKLNNKVKRVIASLGVGSHLEYWGIAHSKITELNWWEELNISENIKLTATPARHFSGRTFTRGKTLWSSFVLQLFGYKLFLGGDSGYDKQFKIIGEKFNGFDIAFLETGQYNDHWPLIHMAPEEAIQAAQDLNAKMLLPVHWGKFSLAFHPWNEPPKRSVAAAEKMQQPIVIPMIGQPYTIDEPFDQTTWWNFE